MKFSPKCRTKKLELIFLGSFCSFLNWEGADIWPQSRTRKIPVKALIKLCAMFFADTSGTAFREKQERSKINKIEEKEETDNKA